MTLFFSRFKTYGLAIVAAVVSALAVIVRLLMKRNSQLSRRAENAEEKARRAVIIAEADIEIERAKEKIRREQKDSGNPGVNDPNSLWDSEDDS